MDDEATTRLAAAREELATATAALDGRTKLPARRRTRAAAIIGRTALEHLVQAALLARGHRLTEASMRVQLICLSTLVSPDAGRTAHTAWAGLSQGCHHHAYELSPTASEVRHLLALVDQLADLTIPQADPTA